MKVAFSFIFSLYCMVAAQDVPDSIKGGTGQDSSLEEKLGNLEFVTEPYRTTDSSAIPIVRYDMLDDRPTAITYPRVPNERTRHIDGQYHGIVKMLIAGDGSVIDSKIVRPSGNAELDSIMLDAVFDFKFTPPKYKEIYVRTWVSTSYSLRRIQ